jgi:hypothetical protein
LSSQNVKKSLEKAQKTMAGMTMKTRLREKILFSRKKTINDGNIHKKSA